MLTRTLMVLVASAAIANGPLFAQQAARDDVTGFLVLDMSGELAAAYGKLAGSVKEGQIPPPGLSISTTAIVAQHLDDGRVRIEHTMPVMQNGSPIRLVTLSVIVDSKAVKTRITPAGTATYTSPGAHKSGEKPALTARETSRLTLELADLKGVKLRSWTLASEIGGLSP